MTNGRIAPALLLTVAALAASASPPSLQAQDPAEAETGAADSVPLYDDLGSHHYDITTTRPEAQRYFDQGLRLYYAFNHAEAVRSFRVAQSLDPECAMCWWGEALAWGPNINLPMDSAAGVAAWRAVREARDRIDHAAEKERDLIEALSARYVPEPPADRAHLDRAYAAAMGELADRYPRDPEIRVLHAEALMDLRPWDYWKENGEPQPGIADALRGLERIRELDPDHPGACHFYIHAVEKLYPERAVACAELLADLMPGAGHLVHMPGHIYIRVGRYRDAVRANRHAIHADETYIQDQRPGVGMYTAGYYPHNYDFLAFAAMMIGDSETSLEAADRVVTLLPEELFGAPGMDFLQHWSMRPVLVRTRFNRWDEIRALSRPGTETPHALALWHYGQGRARTAGGALDDAEGHLEELRAILVSGRLDDLGMEFNRSSDLVAIAERVLAGRLHAARGRYPAAVTAMETAVELEDALLYGEPPEWSVPTRQELGEVLLEAGRWAEAEEAFRADLDRFPENGWSLAGLTVALREQGRGEEAATVERRLRSAWETADVPLPLGLGRGDGRGEAGSGAP